MSTELNDEQIDRLLMELSREGFDFPHMARTSDYDTVEALRAADDEADRMNREALRTALRTAVFGSNDTPTAT